MSSGLFNGKISPDNRIRVVANMMGYHPASLDYPREHIEKMLSKAEGLAYEFLCREIQECLRGEAARRYKPNSCLMANDLMPDIGQTS